MSATRLPPQRVAVCASEDVPEGGRLVVDVGGVTVGIFRTADALHCFENTCPHQGGPVCQGMVIGAVDERLGEHRETVARRFDEDDLRIVCPWHGFEFSIATGTHPSVPRYALKRYPVDEEDGSIHVTI